jgi:hypothetical protein
MTSGSGDRPLSPRPPDDPTVGPPGQPRRQVTEAQRPRRRRRPRSRRARAGERPPEGSQGTGRTPAGKAELPGGAFPAGLDGPEPGAHADPTLDLALRPPPPGWRACPRPRPGRRPDPVADKGYASAEFERRLAEHGIELIRPAMKRERPRPGAPQLRSIRQIIESVNATTTTAANPTGPSPPTTTDPLEFHV